MVTRAGVADARVQGFQALIVSNDFTFDPAQLPQVGLWLNAGGWSGTGGKPYYNLALEPCIGAQDSLERAVSRYGRYKRLPLGGVHEWWLEVQVIGDGARPPPEVGGAS